MDLSIPPPPSVTKKTPVPQPETGPVPKFVSEQEYWDKYYEAEIAYEWNNGKLEEKPVSDYATGEIYQWFLTLLTYYLDTRPIARKTVLDLGFRMQLAKKTVIRKPDLGIVRNDNPVPLHDLDCTYQGVFDLCVEALSTTGKEGKERDTKDKKEEYGAGGVPEYYILHHEKKYQAFYTLDDSGLYVPVKTTDGIVRSRVLPGFQFRVRDLTLRPGPEKMMRDALYQDFVLPGWRADKMKAEAETTRAEAEARARAEAERRAQAAEAEVARLQALLAGTK